MGRSPPRVVRFADVPFAPRFAYGEQCDIGPVLNAKDGSELGFGFARFKNAKIPWTITYDEVLLVIEGELTVHVGKKKLKAKAKESIWLPAGTELVYESEDSIVAYAVHPAGSTPRKSG